VRANAERLHREKPIFAEIVAAGRVKVVGPVYDLATGKVALV
jgi:carbonic anhydrase